MSAARPLPRSRWDHAYATLYDALDAEQAMRPHRPGMTWIAAERARMHAETEQLAGRPIPPEAVEAVEQSCMGHSDYTHKYALRCADLALPDVRAHYEPAPRPARDWHGAACAAALVLAALVVAAFVLTPILLPL